MVLLIVCVVLGAIVNIAVAWVSIFWHFTRSSFITTSTPSDECALLWSRSEIPKQPGLALTGYRQTSFGVIVDVISSFEGTLSNDWNCMHVQAGWPLIAFECIGVGDLAYYRNNSKVEWTYAVTRNTGRIRVLPIGPLWPNLIVNTFFYTAIVWLLIRGPAEARRRWREYKGRCGACGYPRGGSPVCTECGADFGRAWFVPSAKS
jgi:hypothetical protein